MDDHWKAKASLPALLCSRLDELPYFIALLRSYRQLWRNYSFIDGPWLAYLDQGIEILFQEEVRKVKARTKFSTKRSA